MKGRKAMGKLMVIKRDGSREERFREDKIKTAIVKAMKYGSGEIDYDLAESIASGFETEKPKVEISEIEDYVFLKLSETQPLTAKAYESYRAIRENQRKKNTIDEDVWGIVKGTNVELLDENSNKTSSLTSTARDLVAEEVSKDVAMRYMLPANLVQAHKSGIIHIHDLGHYLNGSTNCCLVNLEDMLLNGTCINKKWINSPTSFRTASTIATQIITQVASGQFGGQSISISHLAPFVRRSEQKIRKKLIKCWNDNNIEYTNESLEAMVSSMLADEITDGIQTFQYQLNTMQSSNGRI